MDESLAIPGLLQPVDVVRDIYGIAHIRAQDMSDLGLALGYVQAEDRLQQMDLFRRFASGTLSELFGALDASQIDADLAIRMHRMRPLAQESWDGLQASTDPADRELVAFLESYAQGVNLYILDLVEGRRRIDPALGTYFDPARTLPWSAVDSLAIGRLQAYSLSFDDGEELWLSDMLESARTTFDQADPALDPALASRAGVGLDLYPQAPMQPTSTIDGFPNVAADTGTRALQALRPRLGAQALASARHALAPASELARRLLDPQNGSNNWAVGPGATNTDTNTTVLANDPHLSLASPSMFYPIHLTVPDQLDVAGIGFPGIPGVILGHNQNVAWGSTTVYHDVTDYYLEEVVPCSQGGGDCVMWNGEEVAIETWDETIQIGALGTITDTLTVTYERIPHHGPIIPNIVGHDIAPRAGEPAISVRYTGHDVSYELRSFAKLWRVSNVQDAFEAMDDFDFGGQNWVFTDNQGSIGWTSAAKIPLRSPECYTYHPTDAPDGLAPYLLLPGDGTCEWQGWMDPRYVPHVIDPDSGFLVTANQDPVGATFDGDPLNGPLVDGRPLYVGARYAEGYRASRITQRLEAAIASGEALALDVHMDIQADITSNMGERMLPHLMAAGMAMMEELGGNSTRPELRDWLLGLPNERIQALYGAIDSLSRWSLATPSAVQGTLQPWEINDSVATTIFNVWMVEFLRACIGDELEVMGASVDTANARGVLALLENPEALQTGLAPETGEPLLCDDLTTPDTVESCTFTILVALERALAWAESVDGFGTGDINEWRWGLLHTLTLKPLLPIEVLEIPGPDETEPWLQNGYPRSGDAYAVDAASPGYSDHDFSYGHGPAMRHIVEFSLGGPPEARIAIPGGVSSRRDSGHFRDLMDEYWSQNQYFEPPWTEAQITSSAELRWRFLPVNE